MDNGTAPSLIVSDPSVLESLQEVGHYMLQHWIAFSVIFLFVIGITITATVFFYKNRIEELITKEKRLKQQEKDLKKKKRELQRDIDEINSPQYHAYLLAQGISRQTLIDSNMFDDTNVSYIKAKINGRKNK